MHEFEKFPSIPRLSRDIVITEKLDGTNAALYIETIPNHITSQEIRKSHSVINICNEGCVVKIKDKYWLLNAAGRNRFIYPEGSLDRAKGCDNFGFAQWAYKNAYELVTKLGAGTHHGEWWGGKIQRGYGLKEKRFSLFNTHLWNDETKPDCCHVVPVLYSGPFSTARITCDLNYMKAEGSHAAPGYMNPEGIIIYHTAANMYFKKTIEKDEGKHGKL